MYHAWMLPGTEKEHATTPSSWWQIQIMMMGLGECVLVECTFFSHSSMRGLTTTVHLYLSLPVLGTLFTRRLGSEWLSPNSSANTWQSSMLIALLMVPFSCWYMALNTSLILAAVDGWHDQWLIQSVVVIVEVVWLITWLCLLHFNENNNKNKSYYIKCIVYGPV